MSKTTFQYVYQYAHMKIHITVMYKLHAKGLKK